MGSLTTLPTKVAALRRVVERGKAGLPYPTRSTAARAASASSFA